MRWQEMPRSEHKKSCVYVGWRSKDGEMRRRLSPRDPFFHSSMRGAYTFKQYANVIIDTKGLQSRGATRTGVMHRRELSHLYLGSAPL